MKLYKRTNFIHPFSMIFGNKILNNFCNFPLVQLVATAAVAVAAAAAGAAAAAAAAVVLKE
jgi:hypothetical protein